MANQVYLQDSNGLVWAVTINTDGSLAASPTGLSSPYPTPSAAGCSITVQQVVSWAQTFSKLVPLLGVGGIANEPGLSIANNVLKHIVNRPFAWKFNSYPMTPLFTRWNIRDYIYSGAVAFVLKYSANGLSAQYQGGAAIALAGNNGIVESGNTVTVTTLEPHPFQVGQTVAMLGNTNINYNSTQLVQPVGNTSGNPSVTYTGWVITAIPTANTFQFTHTLSGLPVSGAPGIYNFGWMEFASKNDPNSQVYPQPEDPITVVRKLLPISDLGDPEKMSVQKDNGDGTLSIRLWPTPGAQPWQINPTYQAKATQ